MYIYDPKKGDPEYPVSAGVQFKALPEDWLCPTCGAAPKTFKNLGKEVAGFEQNQGYGLGTNSMTGGEKSVLIYGALALFFLFFISAPGSVAIFAPPATSSVPRRISYFLVSCFPFEL